MRELSIWKSYLILKVEFERYTQGLFLNVVNTLKTDKSTTLLSICLEYKKNITDTNIILGNED